MLFLSTSGEAVDSHYLKTLFALIPLMSSKAHKPILLLSNPSSALSPWKAFPRIRTIPDTVSAASSQLDFHEELQTKKKREKKNSIVFFHYLCSTMMRINVATDLWGVKDNVEFVIDPTTTSIAQLMGLIERTYQAEAVARCPPEISMRAVPPFRIVSMLILHCPPNVVDIVGQRWEEVVSETQLFDGCQLYVFQPEHPFHSDGQGRLPLPRQVGEASTTFSPRRGSQALSPLEAAHVVFKILEPTGNVLRLGELKGALLMLDLDLHQFDGPFLFDDRGRKPYLTMREWLSFAEQYPGVVAMLASRLGGAPARVSGRVELTNKNVSPPRHHAASPDQRQRTASERLSAGLSSIVSGKDRKLEQSEKARDPVQTEMESRAAQGVNRSLRASSQGRQRLSNSRAGSRSRLSNSSNATDLTRSLRSPRLAQQDWILYR